MAPKKNKQTPENTGRILAGLPPIEKPKAKAPARRQSPIEDLGIYFGGVGPMPTQEQMDEARVISGMPSFPRQTDTPAPNVGGFGVTLPQDFFGNFNLAEFQAQYGYTPEVPAKSTTPGTPTGTTAATNTTTANKVSAFDKLRERLNARNLGSLYDSIVGLVQADLPEEEFTLQLRATPAYQQRFKANTARIASGLQPVSEAAYLDLEDEYQGVMRRRGLPDTYWTRGPLGEQTGFDALISGDVSADELDSRIASAQMVINANPQVMQSLKAYYPEVTNGDVLSYVLNPKTGLVDIERKIRGAQIGGAALTAGLAAPGAGRIGELVGAGVSEEQAQRGFQSIANILPESQKLSQIYDSGGYTQAEAEAEAFGLAGGIEAGRKRRRLASQERAAFEGQAGLSATAFEKGRAGAF